MFWESSEHLLQIYVARHFPWAVGQRMDLKPNRNRKHWEWEWEERGARSESEVSRAIFTATDGGALSRSEARDKRHFGERCRRMGMSRVSPGRVRVVALRGGPSPGAKGAGQWAGTSSERTTVWGPCAAGVEDSRPRNEEGLTPFASPAG